MNVTTPSPDSQPQASQDHPVPKLGSDTPQVFSQPPTWLPRALIPLVSSVLGVWAHQLGRGVASHPREVTPKQGRVCSKLETVSLWFPGRW